MEGIINAEGYKEIQNVLALSGTIQRTEAGGLWETDRVLMRFMEQG